MAKRKKLRSTRPKALFGEAAAIAAQTVAQIANAALQAQATRDSARTQADSVLENAKSQAEAMRQQNENNTKLQTQMMEFTKSQNDQNRQIMKDMQMNMQLTAGAQSARDRREASKIVLKRGGSARRKLRDAYSSLQGGNIPFRVTDGGYALAVGQTPEGYDIYKFIGDTHKDYHKTRSGKYKSGIGLKFPNGSEIEVENGEYGVGSPEDMYVYSAHTRHNFNPAKAIEAGMSPNDVAAIQETYKAIDGIDSEGNNTSPVKRILTSAGKTTRQQINSLKNRHRYDIGGWWLAPTISGAGNLLGAGLSALGIGTGSNYLSKRVGEAGDILANAYGQLKGVSMEDVFGPNANGKLSFSLGHYLPVIRSSYYNANPELAQVDKDARRQTSAVNRNTLSSAARLSRTNLANTFAQDARSKIYADKANREEQTKQANVAAINEAAAHNAQLDIEMNKQFYGTKADLAKFNANIENEKILGAAETRANTLQQLGQIGANKRQGIAGAFGNALVQTGLGFANAYNDKLTRDFELDLAKLGANQEGLTTWYANSKNVSDSEAYAYARNLIESAKTTSGPARANAIKNANLILSSRGYPTVDENNLYNYGYNDLSRTSLRNVHPGYNYSLPTGLRGVRLS